MTYKPTRYCGGVLGEYFKLGHDGNMRCITPYTCMYKIVEAYITMHMYRRMMHGDILEYGEEDEFSDKILKFMARMNFLAKFSDKDEDSSQFFRIRGLHSSKVSMISNVFFNVFGSIFTAFSVSSLKSL
ncbi:unnamed protein product [Lathyrus oleraceus]